MHQVFLKFGYKSDGSSEEASKEEIVEQPGISSSKNLCAYIHILGKNGEGIANKSLQLKLQFSWRSGDEYVSLTTNEEGVVEVPNFKEQGITQIEVVGGEN